MHTRAAGVLCCAGCENSTGHGMPLMTSDARLPVVQCRDAAGLWLRLHQQTHNLGGVILLQRQVQRGGPILRREDTHEAGG